MTDINLNAINTKIQLLKKTAKELSHDGEDFPAIARNTVRILASVKMLEINVLDLAELDLQSVNAKGIRQPFNS